MAEGDGVAAASGQVNEPKAVLLLQHSLCGIARDPEVHLCLSEEVRGL